MLIQVHPRVHGNKDLRISCRSAVKGYEPSRKQMSWLVVTHKGSHTSLHIVIGQNLHLHVDSMNSTQCWGLQEEGDFSVPKRNTGPKPNGSIPVPGVVFMTQIAEFQPRYFCSLLQLLREMEVRMDVLVKSPSLFLLVSLFLAMNLLGLQIKTGISCFRLHRSG